MHASEKRTTAVMIGTLLVKVKTSPMRPLTLLTARDASSIPAGIAIAERRRIS